MINKMDTEAAQSHLEQLCKGLLEQTAYQALRQSLERFASDDDSIRQYEKFIDTTRRLEEQHKQGGEPSAQEIEDYEQEEQSLYENDVIRKFIYAQSELSKFHQWVSQYVQKTIELNRLPEAGELKIGGCGCGGGGCGNH